MRNYTLKEVKRLGKICVKNPSNSCSHTLHISEMFPIAAFKISGSLMLFKAKIK